METGANRAVPSSRTSSTSLTRAAQCYAVTPSAFRAAAYAGHKSRPVKLPQRPVAVKRELYAKALAGPGVGSMAMSDSQHRPRPPPDGYSSSAFPYYGSCRDFATLDRTDL
jgi:hypothetical protein